LSIRRHLILRLLWILCCRHGSRRSGRARSGCGLLLCQRATCSKQCDDEKGPANQICNLAFSNLERKLGKAGWLKITNPGNSQWCRRECVWWGRANDGIRLVDRKKPALGLVAQRHAPAKAGGSVDIVRLPSQELGFWPPHWRAGALCPASLPARQSRRR
jgi:hypothetical protein